MSKHLLHIFISLLVMGSSVAMAADMETFDLEHQLLTLINQARHNPMDTVVRLGLDPEQVLANHPNLQDILLHGLPPLFSDSKLRSAARSHTEDMLNRNYYGGISPEGVGPEERISAFGYLPQSSGETLGVLGFFNFVAPADAVDRIFENLFRDELDPLRTEKRTILSDEFEEVGIGFGSGLLDINDRSYNTYLVTCDFGASMISTLELEFLELVNQARRDPLAVAQSLGMDTEKLITELPELSGILQNGLPPLSFNPRLFVSAKQHGRDMLENGYFSEVSLDGRSVNERMVDSGYIPIDSAEMIGSLSSDLAIDPYEGALAIFQTRFREELRPNSGKTRAILNPFVEEAGIYLNSFLIFSDSEFAYAYHLLTGTFGTEISDEKPPILSGIVFADANNDGLFTIGEGIGGVALTVINAEGEIDLYTDRAGRFECELAPGNYTVVLMTDGHDLIEQKLIMEGENKGIIVPFPQEMLQ